MKKIIRGLMLLAVASMFAVANSNAQIVVRIRPHRPGAAVVIRGRQPSPRHVWVGEEWTPNGNTYAYHAGYWALPPRPGSIWIAGHWTTRRGGSVWIAGHWR